MARRQLRIAVIGTGKMARARSHAYLTAARLFELPVEPVLAVVAGHSSEHTQQMASAFGWQHVAYDWHDVIRDADVDLVDVCTPNALHADVACAAAERGRGIVCEKPLARNVEEAKRMVDAVERSGVANTVVFNYRYAPAVRHARNLIIDGVLGDVRQLRLHFLHDWLMDPARLMSWRLSAEAGGGVLLDLGPHLVDLAHYLIAPIIRVAAVDKRFTNRVSVDVEDALEAVLVTDTGAIGTLTLSRVAGGYRSQNGFEVVGSRGSLRWEFQRMNELDVYLAHGSPPLRGWRTVTVTELGIHPWASTWWGAGPVLGYEATFVHQVTEFLSELDAPTRRAPTFEDGLRCQRVLAALVTAAGSMRWVDV
jgi:predicted dehydrogenase